VPLVYIASAKPATVREKIKENKALFFPAKRKVTAARLGAVSGKTDALGDRWRGIGAAKRPREPGGAQGLPAAVAVAYGVVDMAVMGAVPGSGYSLCVTRSGVADVPSGRRSDRSVVEAKGTALLDEVSMIRLASDRVGEVGVDAGGDGHHLGWWCAESAEPKQPERVRCRGYCCGGAGGAGGAANGGPGHTRAEKLKRFGWRRICRGCAADGGAGHTRAEKLKRFGWRRICRGGAADGGAGHTNKTAATIGLLSELVNGSGMDYTKWDDTVLATAALFGFYKLRRSGEFLRKDGVHLANKDTCVLVGDTRLLKGGVELAWNDPRALEADELLARQRFSKADQAGLGAVTNTFALRDEALCVVAWVKCMLRLKPGHFQNPANFLFTVSDGKVLSSGKMAQALKSASGRLGLREEEVDVISLRSGGATAMYHAGFSVEATQRRGRWASGCWQIYVQDARDTAKDVAERMAAASVTLL